VLRFGIATALSRAHHSAVSVYLSVGSHWSLFSFDIPSDGHCPIFNNVHAAAVVKILLIFTVRDMSPSFPNRAIVAKIIVPAELMAALAQMIAMDAKTPTERPAEFLGLLVN
jgi:hypothetical protein